MEYFPVADNCSLRFYGRATVLSQVFFNAVNLGLGKIERQFAFLWLQHMNQGCSVLLLQPESAPGG
jgi:hypothetical protein